MITIPKPGESTTAPKSTDPKPPVLPGSESKTAPVPAPPGASTASGVSPPKTSGPDSKTDATQVPIVPGGPVGKDALPLKETSKDAPAVKTPPPMSTGASSSKSEPATLANAPGPRIDDFPPPKPKRRIRNALLTLTLLSATGFGAGVFYSLKSDNVHDFFTEYIPFGEEAVLYFEEREFRRRFPNALAKIEPAQPTPKVTIPKSAGATWKIADKKPVEVSSDVSIPGGPHISSKKTLAQEEERAAVAAAPVVPITAASPASASEVSRAPPVPSEDTAKVEKATGDAPVKAAPASAPATKLTELELPEATDPVVVDLVRAINTIITSANASGSSSYDAALESAKAELQRLNTEITTLKTSADERLANQDLEFSKAAQGLVLNAQQQLRDLELSWAEEFSVERDRITAQYRERLATELARSQELAEQRLHNELLEQAIEMKRQWISQIQNQVETERSGRLGKLAELETAVHELEQVALSASTVVDRNLKTQHLFTAIEAVRNAAESELQPRPFLREMAALKEVASDNDVIAAAIASINPAAYQDGVSTHTQLVDRFRHVAEEVRKAALLPQDAGIAAHAGNWVLSKVLFRRREVGVEEDAGDVESVLTRTERWLEEGDVDKAAREVNQLRGWARILAMDWLREARRVLEVKQAVDVSISDPGRGWRGEGARG